MNYGDLYKCEKCGHSRVYGNNRHVPKKGEMDCCYAEVDGAYCLCED